MSDICLVCDRVGKIINKQNPYFVAELETGYVVIGDFQYYKGYTLFLCKEHKVELHDLDKDFRIKFLKEMSEVAEAVYRVFKPKKLNYECLGNLDRHLHWHIFPRYEGDPMPKATIWNIDKSIRNSEEARPSHEELEKLKKRLLSELKTTATSIKSELPQN